MYHRTIAVALLLVSSTVAAQLDNGARPEIRPFVGAYMPTGKHHDDFKAAGTFGMQGAVEVSHNWHAVASLGFSQTHARFAAMSSDVTYIWQYDIGAEYNAYQELDEGFAVRPFVGASAGARTYDYKANGIGTNTCTAGYAALGSELQADYLPLRVEGREYLHCFKSPATGRNATRNDLALSLGVAIHLW